MRNGQILNTKAFGHLLREKRKEQGYRNTKDFSAAIYDRTGLTINAETLARYERGERKPDIEQFLALTITLAGGVVANMEATDFPSSVFSECLAGKPAFERLERATRGAAVVLDSIERDLERGDLSRAPWKAKNITRLLGEIREEIINLGGFSEEAAEMGITEQEIETLTNRATILFGLMGV